MNQRESSGLPLRAMVMVLLFLGVVFLLVGFQALGSGDDSSGAESTVSSTTTTTTTTATPTPMAAPDPATIKVMVFNVSDIAGAAETTANRLRDAHFADVQTDNLTIGDVNGTTVYFGDTPGEKEAADEVGKVLEAPVEPRRAELNEQPPGVIVLVTG
ncbi:LytR C-terminal domain-containing protein [Mycobacterium sp. 155]|uniref:LytR C-terminal domain-containing protein n=1 Tax=Mycobacterium sp. 155 TaxID=1157943 RepID=UPI00047647E1|nr:LytR C-terminal domain-containing protein [Mycobacterium sp. 155]